MAGEWCKYCEKIITEVDMGDHLGHCPAVEYALDIQAPSHRDKPTCRVCRSPEVVGRYHLCAKHLEDYKYKKGRKVERSH